MLGGAGEPPAGLAVVCTGGAAGWVTDTGDLVGVTVRAVRIGKESSRRSLPELICLIVGVTTNADVIGFGPPEPAPPPELDAAAFHTLGPGMVYQEGWPEISNENSDTYVACQSRKVDRFAVPNDCLISTVSIYEWKRCLRQATIRALVCTWETNRICSGRNGRASTGNLNLSTPEFTKHKIG